MPKSMCSLIPNPKLPCRKHSVSNCNFREGPPEAAWGFTHRFREVLLAQFILLDLKSPLENLLSFRPTNRYMDCYLSVVDISVMQKPSLFNRLTRYVGYRMSKVYLYQIRWKRRKPTTIFLLGLCNELCLE